jgi:hypothetical protein
MSLNVLMELEVDRLKNWDEPTEAELRATGKILPRAGNALLPHAKKLSQRTSGVQLKRSRISNDSP